MVPVTLVLAWSLTVEQAHVVTLIRQLGDNRYAVRTAAQLQLEQVILSDHGHLHRGCIESAMRNRDPEIARRATLLLEEYYNIRPSGYPVLPWIDMLPAAKENRQAIIERVLGQARSASGWAGGSDWPDYRYATYLYASELLREGKPRKIVRQLLDEMVVEERDYRAKRGLQPMKSD